MVATTHQKRKISPKRLVKCSPCNKQKTPTGKSYRDFFSLCRKECHLVSLLSSSRSARHSTRTVKNNYSLRRYKDNASQVISIGNFYSSPAPSHSRYHRAAMQILIFFQLHLVLNPGHPIKTKIRETVPQRLFCRNPRFRDQSEWLQFQKALHGTKNEGSSKDQTISSSFYR